MFQRRAWVGDVRLSILRQGGIYDNMIGGADFVELSLLFNNTETRLCGKGKG